MDLLAQENYSHTQRIYTRGIKKIVALHKKMSALHSIEGHFADKKMWRSWGTSSMAEKSVFDPFSGEWHGKWRSEKVDHLWLPTHRLPVLGAFDHTAISVLAFQSVYTGDGIGWNYLVQHEEMQFIVGFVGHFNDEGVIYMKRPHIGISHPNGALIWKTKDHMYLEFVCRAHNCHKETEHYVITGISYDPRKRKLKPLEAFQAIYTREPMHRPNCVSIKKK